ncbi:hypothetical protein GCM10009740_20730 [Terrabacter terrae]|uniref:Amidohydrolase-related domain-containing protein n=1 Tax=Terrabacter terrae TaxID=318434 RepID=A0ABP5FR47_9MICO
MYADHLTQPWLDCLTAKIPDIQVFDAHTHLGGNDPSGFAAGLDELLDALDAVDGRAAVFPLAEPAGYRDANLACAKAAESSPQRLVAFARITPEERPTELLKEALAAGARGVKLHLSSDDFSLADPRLENVYEIAHERHLPVIVHAGPELPTLGEDPLRVCARWPGLRLILAHCALTDLDRLSYQFADTPNLFVDTSWWTPANVLAAMKLVPPGRILNASDLPYCSPAHATFKTIRCAWQVGLKPDQIASVIGGQFARLIDGATPLDLGPPPAGERAPIGPSLETVATNLLAALESTQRGEDPGVCLTVARHACTVRDDDPQAPALASVVQLLDLYEEHQSRIPKRNQFSPGWDLISAAAFIARTPAAPLP